MNKRTPTSTRGRSNPRAATVRYQTDRPAQLLEAHDAQTRVFLLGRPEMTMPQTPANQHRDPARNDPEDELESLPVEPDEGLVPAAIPDDPEQQRVVQPAD